MSDINFVIGAKDNASQPIKGVEGSLNRLVGGLVKMTGALVAAKAAWSAFTGAIGGIQGSIEAFTVQQEAVEGLRNALEQATGTTGPAVDEQVKAYEALASEMQKTLGIGDEVTLGLMKQASIMGVSSDSIDEVTQSTIGLAKATGKSLEEAQKLVINATKGEFGAFGELIPEIKNATTAQEKLALVNGLASKGLDAQADAINRTQGKIQNAKNAIGDLAEKIGEALSPAVNFAADGLVWLAEAAQGWLQPAIEKIQTAIIAFVSASQVVWENFGETVEFAITSALLQFERFKEIGKHIFSEVVPAYVVYFGELLVSVFKNVFEGVLVAVSNMGEKLVDSLAIIWDNAKRFISGESTNLAAELASAMEGGLLAGFQGSEIPSLPEIIERQINEKEQSLQDKLAGLGVNLAAKLADKFDANMKKFRDGVDVNVKSELELGVNANLGKSKGQQQLAAQESRLLTRGPGTDKQQQLIDLVADLNKKTDEANAQRARLESEARQQREALENQDRLVLEGAPV